MTIQDMKKNAKLKLSGNYLKCVFSALIYFIIVLVLTYLLKFIILKLNQQILEIIIEAIFSIISFTLAIGITVNIINLTDNKSKGISKFLDNSLLNFTKYAKILFHIIVKIAIPLVLFGLATFYHLGTSIAYSNNKSFLCFSPNYIYFSTILFLAMSFVLIYFILKFIIVPYVSVEHPEFSAKEIVENSRDTMKGNIFNYILLILSFLPWIILMSIILFIFNKFIPAQFLTPFVILFDAILKPYTTTSISMFYDDIKNQDLKNKTKV